VQNALDRASLYGKACLSGGGSAKGRSRELVFVTVMLLIVWLDGKGLGEGKAVAKRSRSVAERIL